MSNPEEKKAAKTNGAGVDMSERLATFKPPRDFTLGGSKPNRKVFTPNLNVSRNKTKGPSATGNKEQKKDERGKRERKNDRNRNLRNGANVIKSGGVFSEGLGGGQKHSSRGSYNRDSESAPSVLQRPIIRVKDVVKIDKELEEQRIKAAVARGAYDDDDDDDFKGGVDRMAPIRLPMDDGGWSTNQTKKVTVKVKEEVIVKTEPEDPTDIGTPVVETKPRVTVKKEVVDDSNLVNLLNNDQPTMLLIKFPDTLPGRGGESEDSPPQRKPKQTASTAAATSEDDDTKPVEPRCQLKHLEEGKVGKLQIHRSGRVTLALGNTTFEVSLGTRSVCHQQLVSVAADSGSRAASLVALGPLLHKLNVIPDWLHMLHDI